MLLKIDNTALAALLPADRPDATSVGIPCSTR